MANCKTCGDKIEWAKEPETGKWIPLEPIATHAELDKWFIDASGALRADHRERCSGAGITVTRLKEKVPGRKKRRAVA